MHSRFHTAFSGLPGELQTALAPLLADEHFPAMLSAEQVATVQSAAQLDTDALAFALLPLAAACARTDLSHFNVGAIARGVSGNWYFGANMEFIGATMQQTVHAEQSAHTLADYLPDAFGPKDLEIKTLLMDEQNHGFSPRGDALTQAAITAASQSHSPYTNSPSGVALLCRDGQIFSGRYAENAAFNPTLPPLQGALNLLSLSGFDYPDITRAVLAERADAPLTQWDATVATLRALGCEAVERVTL